MGTARTGLAPLALAAPPVALAVALWPEPEPPVADDGADAGGAFRQPVTEESTAVVDVGGVVYIVTLRPGPAGVCLDVTSGASGSSGCGDLASQADLGGVGGSSDGRTTRLEAVGLIGPEVDRVVLVPDDGEPVEAVLAELPGRPERVYVAQMVVAGDAFAVGAVGVTVQALDAEGEVIDQAAV